MNTGLCRITVCKILQRNALNRLSPLEVEPPPQRYQHETPEDSLHLDIKKLGRLEQVGHRIIGQRTGQPRRAGWEYVHVAIDDCPLENTRLRDRQCV